MEETVPSNAGVCPHPLKMCYQALMVQPPSPQMQATVPTPQNNKLSSERIWSESKMVFVFILVNFDTRVEVGLSEQ